MNVRANITMRPTLCTHIYQSAVVAVDNFYIFVCKTQVEKKNKNSVSLSLLTCHCRFWCVALRISNKKKKKNYKQTKRKKSEFSSRRQTNEDNKCAIQSAQGLFLESSTRNKWIIFFVCASLSLPLLARCMYIFCFTVDSMSFFLFVVCLKHDKKASEKTKIKKQKL